jgi:hypothetical protein
MKLANLGRQSAFIVPVIREQGTGNKEQGTGNREIGR